MHPLPVDRAIVPLLRIAFFLFLACTLIHFVHNAEFLADYLLAHGYAMSGPGRERTAPPSSLKMATLRSGLWIPACAGMTRFAR